MLKVEGLVVEYPDHTRAVDGICFSISAGENVALVGANGAGKTTLLLALVGILESAGSIKADGIALNRQTLARIRGRVGLVFQNPDDQLFMPRIYDDIAFGPRNSGADEAEAEYRVNESLSALHIEHLKERSPLKLSGGEKRAAAIATVLAMRPAIMLFDEPTAFLDPRARRSLIDLMHTLPHTKLIATHDLRFAAETCARTIALKNGKIAADGETGALLSDARLMDECRLESIPQACQIP